MKKFTKEEKAIIKAYVNLYISKGYITTKEECTMIEQDTFRLLDRRNSEERYYIEDYARELIEKELSK